MNLKTKAIKQASRWKIIVSQLEAIIMTTSTEDVASACDIQHLEPKVHIDQSNQWQRKAATITDESWRAVLSNGEST